MPENGIIHGDLSSGKSAKYKQVIFSSLQNKLSDLFVDGFFERKVKIILKLTKSIQM